MARKTEERMAPGAVKTMQKMMKNAGKKGPAGKEAMPMMKGPKPKGPKKPC